MKYIIGFALSLFAFNAQSVMISYTTSSSSTVSVGDSIEIDIIISDSALGSLFSISEFLIDTKFDNLILSDNTEITPTIDIYGGKLGVPGTESSTFTGVDEGVALDIVFTNETSSLSDVQLLSLQSPSFRIATLYFDVLSSGITTINADSIVITSNCESVKNESDCLTYSNSLSINSVPIPASAWLFGSGLIGLIGLARRSV